jgi:hypothetical protein
MGMNFIKGALLYMALESLVRDIMGKEAYIIYVRDAWLSGWYTVPFALIALAFIIIDTVQDQIKLNKLYKKYVTNETKSTITKTN